MRERTRRLVQGELTVIAQDLFVEQRYEETTVEQIAEALSARAADELVWESLRRVLDIPAHSTPTLTAGYLEKLSRMQFLLVDESMTSFSIN